MLTLTQKNCHYLQALDADLHQALERRAAHVTLALRFALNLPAPSDYIDIAKH